MEFRVIFSPHKEETTTYDTTVDVLRAALFERPANYEKRILPKKGVVGIHILDLYRKKTGDDQVTLKDLPSSIAKDWRDDEYFEATINEETARTSGKFLESDTFYCLAKFDLMKTFEDVDIIDDNTGEPKLLRFIDRDKILSEWIKQKYPKELQPLKVDSL